MTRSLTLRAAVVSILIQRLQQLFQIIAPGEDVDLSGGVVFQQIFKPSASLPCFERLQLVVAILIKPLQHRGANLLLFQKQLKD